jgi:hypothetical protein
MRNVRHPVLGDRGHAEYPFIGTESFTFLGLGRG